MIHENVVFIGLTKPTMIARVTFEALLAEVLITILFYLYSGLIFGTGKMEVAALGAIVPLHVLNILLIAWDPSVYRVVLSAAMERAKTMANNNYWSGQSYGS